MMADLPAATILIVEDNEANLMLAETILQMAGYRVGSAISAEVARAWLQQSRPDLILMDVRLPGVDGLTFTRELKSNPSTSSIPVLAVTAHAMAGDGEAALAAGCDGYITKPLTVRGLVDCVTSALHRAESTTPLS